MGKDDDLNTSLAHIVLCAVAGNSLSRVSGKSFTHPGMHANFFIHGILGLLHYQSSTFNNDFTAMYTISQKASKYLALPCLMADLYHDDQSLSVGHLATGVIPFVLALSGNDNPELGHVLIACNVVSLCYYAHTKNNEWGWYTAASACLAYFVTTQVKFPIVYPLTLALMEYCAFRMFHARFDDSTPSRGRRL